RKPGSKNRLAEEFIKAVATDFELHGPSVIKQVRIERPEVWLKIVSDLMPRETQQAIEGIGGAFAGCESVGEVVNALLNGLEIGEALAMCDTMRTELLRVANENAKPISAP